MIQVRKIDFTIKIESEAEVLSRPKSIGILTVLRCISCPDLVILAYTGDKLSRGQVQTEVKFDFHVKLDLEVQGRSPPKRIGILTKVFCTFVSNLVILAWTADELSCGQASDWYTHTLTDTQTGAMTIPEGQNWPRVIKRSTWAHISKGVLHANRSTYTTIATKCFPPATYSSSSLLRGCFSENTLIQARIHILP